MSFEIRSVTPWKELEPQFRAVTLLNDINGETVYPYENARISLQQFRYDEVRPTSLYAIRSNLAVQDAIRSALEVHGMDPLELDCGVSIGEEVKEPLLFTPPVVEKSDEVGNYIIDGLHRSYLGLKTGRKEFVGVYVEGIREDCPGYAFPNEWSEVIEYDEVPREPALKKRYRPDAFRYYRKYKFSGSKPRVNEK